MLMQRARGTGDIGWCRHDASVAPASVLSAATDCVRDRLHGAVNVGADQAR